MGNNDRNLIFLGTPKFAAIILEYLINSPFRPKAIITEPDMPSGRRQILTPPPVKLKALTHGIPVYQPPTLEELHSAILKLQPKIIILAAYGKIIPPKTLAIPPLGILNIHPSLLPKYRGPSPIHTAILNGESQTGVSLMLLDEKIDHGPVLDERMLSISPQDNQETLSEKLADLGSRLLLEDLPLYFENKIKPRPQNHAEATFTKLIKKTNGEIHWDKTPQEIERQIRAFYPWPGSYFIYHGERYIIHQAHLENNQLVIDMIHPQGKKPMDFAAFRNGYPEVLTHLPKFIKVKT